MPDPIMIEVEIDGTKHKVPLPEGFLSADSVSAEYMRKDTFESELGKRALSIAKNKGYAKPDDLMSDEEFIKKLMEAQGLVKKGDPGGGGDNKPTAEQVAALQADWRAKEVAPLEEKLAGSEGRNKGLIEKILESSILQAGALAGVKERFLKPAAPGQKAPLVSMMGNMFGFDEEHSEHFVVKPDGEGFVITSDGNSGKPYKGVSEFLSDWAGQKENADLIDLQARKGPGAQLPPDMKQSGADVVITREQASDHEQYNKAEETAHKQGGRVIVSGTPTYGAAAAAGGV